MSNKSNGTAFEKEFAQTLSQCGFWVHCIRDNENGQPFDVIAAKDGETRVFDCKDCQQGSFPLWRIEENQITAMRLWQECGNREGLFVLKLPSGIRLLPYTVAMELIGSGKRQLRGKQLHDCTMDFGEWMGWLSRLAAR